MPLSRPQVEAFCGELAALFSVRLPPISHRARIRCRWTKRRTLHLGRAIDRASLAHELAHFFHREMLLKQGKRRQTKLHGREFRAWERLLGNYVAQEFGEGEGVIL